MTCLPWPDGCICSYTWNPDRPQHIIRNGPDPGCTADHTRIDADAHGSNA